MGWRGLQGSHLSSDSLIHNVYYAPQLMQHWCHQAARLMDLEAKFSNIYFPPWVSASSGSIGDFVTPAIIRRNVEFFIATVSLRSSAPAVSVRRSDGYRINCVAFCALAVFPYKINVF